MNRNDYTQYTGYTGSQSPEPTDRRPAYAAPPMHRAYAGAVPNGSLRSTRTNAASNGVASGNSAYPQAGRVFQGSLRRAHLGTFDDYSHQQQQQQQQQLQPYVPDASERRTPDYYTQMAGARATSPPQIAAMPAYHESDYYTPRSTSMRKYDEPQQQQQPHRVTSPVAPLPQQRYARRGSTASNSGAPRITTVEARKSPGPQRLFSSQRVEFGYTSPAPQSALSRSSTPERDEIADIIKDMSNSRIGEISVYLQLHDETKKVKVPLGALSMATLVNLFSDKYRDRLEALGEKEKNAVLPEIYIKDAKSDVFYELEDTKDVVDGSVLSWRPRVIEKTDADKRESVEDIVKALVETVAQLPVQLRGELETVAKDMKTHSDAAIESVKTQIQQITATIASPAPQVSDEIKDTEPSGRPGQLSRSVSLPAAPKAETEVLNTRIRKLELDLAVERQAHRETSEQLARENTQLSEALAKLQAEVAKHPNVLRVRIEEGKQKLKTTYRSLNGRFEDLDALTQEMRKDVTQRGSIPSNQIMKKSAADLRGIEEETKELLAFISTTQADWKRAWEEELQNILNEQ
ncbi:Bud site selection protein 6, partial [Coemansia sp. RSA 2703]